MAQEMPNTEEVGKMKYPRYVPCFQFSTNETTINFTCRSLKISCSNFLFEQGLIFGDFTAEEWEKYFSNSASQIGNSPAVEVYES